jgi:hypothetical protein
MALILNRRTERMMNMKWLLLILLALFAVPVMGEELTDEEWKVQAQAAFARVLAVYPEANDPATPFGRRMAEIDEEWGDAGDPRFDDPQKPILIARIVLAEIEEAKAKKRARAEKRRAAAGYRYSPMKADELGDSAATFGRGPAPQKAPSGTVVTPDGVSNYWTNKDGSVQISGPEGLTTIYRD